MSNVTCHYLKIFHLSRPCCWKYYSIAYGIEKEKVGYGNVILFSFRFRDSPGGISYVVLGHQGITYMSVGRKLRK